MWPISDDSRLLCFDDIDVGGDIGPFQLAIALTVLCLVPICFWQENYGHGHGQSGGGSDTCGDCGEENEVCGLDGVCHKMSPAKEQQSMLASLRSALALIYEQPSVLCLGLSQACFEGAVYTFGKSSLHCVGHPPSPFRVYY